MVSICFFNDIVYQMQHQKVSHTESTRYVIYVLRAACKEGLDGSPGSRNGRVQKPNTGTTNINITLSVNVRIVCLLRADAGFYCCSLGRAKE